MIIINEIEKEISEKEVCEREVNEMKYLENFVNKTEDIYEDLGLSDLYDFVVMDKRHSLPKWMEYSF